MADGRPSERAKAVAFTLRREIDRVAAERNMAGLARYGVKTLARDVASRETAGTSIDPVQAAASWTRTIRRVLACDVEARDDTLRRIALGGGFDLSLFGLEPESRVDDGSDDPMMREFLAEIERLKSQAALLHRSAVRLESYVKGVAV